MGGKTAMLFSALHPEMVAGLIIVDIGPGGYATLNSPSSQSLIHLNIVNTLLSVDLGNFSSRVDIERELAKSIDDAAVRQFLMKNVHREHDHTFRWKLNVDAIAKGLPGIMGSISLEKVLNGKIITGFPVLFIKGGRSGYINTEQEELINRFFPDAQMETVLQAGHWVHADQPEKFMEIVNGFLQSYF
jgi:pimeloyl-ACP methyl ester carboxylesterase